jgi:hypothetical protein
VGTTVGFNQNSRWLLCCSKDCQMVRIKPVSLLLFDILIYTPFSFQAAFTSFVCEGRGSKLFQVGLSL